MRINLNAFLSAKARSYLFLVPVGAILGVAVAEYRARGRLSSYSSSGRVVLSGHLNFSEANPVANDFMSVLGTQLEIMTSEELRERAMIKLRLEQPGASARPDLAARQLPRTTIFELTATSGAAPHVQRYLDLVMEEYIAMRREQRLVSSRSVMDQISSEIARLEKNLNEQEAELFRFKQQKNIVFWEQQSTTAARFLSQLKNREASLRMQLQLAELLARGSSRESLASRVSALEIGGDTEATRRRTGAGVTPAPGSALAAQKLRLHEQEVELEALGRVFLPKHPKYQKLEGEISKLRRLVALLEKEDASTFESEVAGLRSELETILASMGEWEKKVLESTQIEAEHQKLQSAAARTRELYQRLVGSLQSIDFRKGVDDEVIQILKRASVAAELRPDLIAPLRSGLFGGLLAGVGLVLLAIRVDRRAFAVPEVAEALGLDVAVEVPLISRRLQDSIAMADPRCPAHFAEAMRTLRATLALEPAAAAGGRVIVICSSTPGEGKSTVSLNLAYAAAGAGLKTLLVDADARRGSLGGRVGLPANTPGLADLVRTRGDWRDFVRPAGNLGFAMITCGKDASSMVDSMMTRLPTALTSESRSEYDLVIIDSAPIIPVSDTIPYLSLVDRVVLVVRLRTGALQAGIRTLQLLRRSVQRDPLLVVNCARASDSAYGYQEYYSYTERRR